MPLIIETAADGTPTGFRIVNQRADPHPQGDTLKRNYQSFGAALFPLGTAFKNGGELKRIIDNEENLPPGEVLKKVVKFADSIGLDVRLSGPGSSAADVPPKPVDLIETFLDP